jgi:hypothetical protein
MPRASKADTPLSIEAPQVELRDADLGGYTVTFGKYLVDADPAPLFRGLPDDRCQSPHWGYVINGKLVFRYADRDETYVAGDAFYGAPGHVPLCFEGTEIVEFSPTDALNATNEVVGRNMMSGAIQ